MKTTIRYSLFIFAAVLVLSAMGFAQESPQTAVASKTAKFETVKKTDASYLKAIDAHDFAAADKLLSQAGSFKGTVVKAFSPRSGTVLILNFDADYKTALTAVLKKADFTNFPDVSQLVGKEVVISGTFTKFNGASQVELVKPSQISIVQ